MKPPLKITRDSGADVKLLKALEKEGFVEIHDVMIENGRENKKVKNKILPVGVYGQTKWGECVYSDPDCTYNDIRKIIGEENINDAIQLEAHVRNRYDYFVTEDHDFLDKRQELEKTFSIKILSPIELEQLCRS